MAGSGVDEPPKDTKRSEDGKFNGQPGPGRPKGTPRPKFTPPPLLRDFRVVWEGGTDRKEPHESPERRALFEMMCAQPKEFLKQLREMEDSWRKEKRELEAAWKAEAAKGSGEKGPAVMMSAQEEKAEELMVKLLEEWKS